MAQFNVGKCSSTMVSLSGNGYTSQSLAFQTDLIRNSVLDRRADDLVTSSHRNVARSVTSTVSVNSEFIQAARRCWSIPEDPYVCYIFLVSHLPSTKTPVLLAFGYHTFMDPMGIMISNFHSQILWDDDPKLWAYMFSVALKPPSSRRFRHFTWLKFPTEVLRGFAKHDICLWDSI